MTFEQFVTDLQWFLNETGISKKALAKEARVCQSQVSEWSNGRGVRFTERSKRVARIIESYRNSEVSPIPKQIEQAVRDVWRGDQKRADVIANLIYSLKPIVDNEEETSGRAQKTGV